MTYPHRPYDRRRQESLRQRREQHLGDRRPPRPEAREKPFHQKEVTVKRLRVASTFCLIITALLILRMGVVQLYWGPMRFADQAQAQRERVFIDPARRGEIQDRTGSLFAYTMQARSLTASPNQLRADVRLRAYWALSSDGKLRGLNEQQQNELLDRELENNLQSCASFIESTIKDSGEDTQEVKAAEVLEKLKKDSTYEVLVRNVDPDIAEIITQKFVDVAADLQEIRQYPNGAVGANVVGKISQDGQGQFGFEASQDSMLAGINGQTTVDVSPNGRVIPGTTRDVVPATNGASVKLTVDLDLQTYVQQRLEQAKAASGAESASAVVLDVETAQVLAMAQTDTIDPSGNIERQLGRGKEFGNSTISAPFEPGSVAKIITAAGVIDDGLSTPDEVLEVPGSIQVAGVTVRDAWEHGLVNYTTTGVFSKSSNVGTLILSQRLGEERFARLLDAFGIGQTTGIELPSESPGLLPRLEQWSGGTFANLPIGQGMSLTLLQMASVYQTIANGGERIEPRLIAEMTDATGQVVEQPEPAKTRVVSEQTARTVVDMFRGVVQSDPTGVQQGTAPSAAIQGYQVSGKTGTAQQVDPNTGAYSNSNYWITFAGIAPADDPRYVVAIMLDKPLRGVNGEGGQSAAPLFHDIAGWLLDRDNVPLSPPQEGQLILEATG